MEQASCICRRISHGLQFCGLLFLKDVVFLHALQNLLSILMCQRFSGCRLERLCLYGKYKLFCIQVIQVAFPEIPGGNFIIIG